MHQVLHAKCNTLRISTQDISSDCEELFQNQLWKESTLRAFRYRAIVLSGLRLISSSPLYHTNYAVSSPGPHNSISDRGIHLSECACGCSSYDRLCLLLFPDLRELSEEIYLSSSQDFRRENKFEEDIEDYDRLAA